VFPSSAVREAVTDKRTRSTKYVTIGHNRREKRITEETETVTQVFYVNRGFKTDQNRVKKNLGRSQDALKSPWPWQSWLGNVALEYPEGLLFIILAITAASVLVLNQREG
jgi:hypothetical protein